MALTVPAEFIELWREYFMIGLLAFVIINMVVSSGIEFQDVVWGFKVIFSIFR